MIHCDCEPLIVFGVSEFERERRTSAGTDFSDSAFTGKRKCSEHVRYSGFGAGFTETKTTFEAAVDLKHNGKSRRTRCYGGRGSAASRRTLRQNGS